MVEATDTIVAIATPPGRSGLGVVRVSGPGVCEVIPGLVGRELKPRYARFCKFRDQAGRVLDEGIAIFFPAPASYTGEDVLELYAHGSRIVLTQLVNRILALGARLARPGEFTERAFHNDKLDLVQAEAVADLVDAVSDQAARSAMRSMQGEFSGRVNRLLERLISLRLFVEGALDFPEDEIDFLGEADISLMLESCLSELAGIFASARQGALLREGIIAVIVGPPNAGKSTLLNRLAGREAAIVTPVPGTTRDLIEQHILIDGIPIQLIDTAGLRDSSDEIEQEGIRRAMDTAGSADILIAIYEYGRSTGTGEQKLLDSVAGDKHIIVLYNKIDLFDVSPEIKTGNNGNREIMLSAKTGAGVDLLVQTLKEYLGVNDIREDVFMARKRHLDTLERARRALESGLKLYREQRAAELLADDLRLAQQALGEITGEFVADDLLAEIFSRFCIGK